MNKQLAFYNAADHIVTNELQRTNTSDSGTSVLNPEAKVFTSKWKNTNPAHIEPQQNVQNEMITNGNSIPKFTSIRPRQSGLFLAGKVNGVSMSFLVDTGAEPTIVGFSVLQLFPKTTRNSFQNQTAQLQLADGQSLAALGPVMCQVTVGEKTVLDTIYVAAIEDEAILGLGTLNALGFQLSVADVQLGPSNCTKKSTSIQLRKVTLKEDCIIPARSEVVAAGYVDGGNNETLMIGPREGKPMSDGLLVARSLVQNRKGSCPVRVMNSTDKDRRLRKGELIGEAEEVEELIKDNTEPARQNNMPDHLKDLFRETCEREKLSPETTEKLKKLLIKHAHVFAENDNDLGHTNVVKHDIDTGESRPIRQPPRRVPTALQEEFDQEIKTMLNKKIIEPGHSPWASPVVLVRKKDGSLRFCVDYRKLNEMTKTDAYPLPRIDETLEALSGARFFTTLDLLSGYWQVGLTPEARLKSAFCARSGLYLWNVI
jgi:hypothetical protein